METDVFGTTSTFTQQEFYFVAPLPIIGLCSSGSGGESYPHTPNARRICSLRTVSRFTSPPSTSAVDLRGRPAGKSDFIQRRPARDQAGLDLVSA